MVRAHNGRIIKNDSCESWQHGKVCHLNPHINICKCYDYNHEKVHIRRKYQKEINQNNKCHVKMLGFFSVFYFQIFYDCVYQFYDYNYNYTYAL